MMLPKTHMAKLTNQQKLWRQIVVFAKIVISTAETDLCSMGMGMGTDYIIMGHSPYSLRLAPVRKLKFYQKQTWMITLW